MQLHLNDMLEEYRCQSFDILPTFYRKHPVGYVEQGYRTNLSAFLFPVRGEGYFRLDDQSFRFKPGMVIHGCPGKWLTSGNMLDKTLEFYVMYYRTDQETGGYVHRAFEMEIGSNPTLLTLLKMLANVTEQPDSHSRLQAKGLFYSVLAETFSSAARILKNSSHGTVEEAKRYLELHYAQQITLCDLAERFGMGPKYFSEVFKKYTGITPIDYLISYRLKMAYKLLLSTGSSVKETAMAVGYADAYYFSRLFKKQFGFAPSEVRFLPVQLVH